MLSNRKRKRENRWWVSDEFQLTLAIIITWLDCHTLDNLYIHTIIARSPSILKFSNSQLCSLSHYLNGKYVYSQFHTIPSVDHVSLDLRPHCGLRMTSEFSDRLLTRDVFTTIWDITIVELKFSHIFHIVVVSLLPLLFPACIIINIEHRRAHRHPPCIALD